MSNIGDGTMHDDLAERRLKRKNMYKEHSEKDLMRAIWYKLKLKKTRKELEETKLKLSELLCYVTGNRFSKTEYNIKDMKSFVDDYQTDVCDQCDEAKEWKEAYWNVKRQLKVAIDDLYGDCGSCKHSEECKKYPCYCINYNAWEWRGIDEE
jgi:hypothetical protein